MAVMFFLFVGISAILAGKVLDAKEAERKQIAEELATLAQSEIELATVVEDGYYREFRLLSTIRGSTYTIDVIDNRELVVTFVDQEHVVFLSEGVQGAIAPGDNTIAKRDGIIYLNS